MADESVQEDKLARDILPRYGARYLARSRRACCLKVTAPSRENQAAAKISPGSGQVPVRGIGGPPAGFWVLPPAPGARRPEPAAVPPPESAIEASSAATVATADGPV